MSFNEALNDRILNVVSEWGDVESKKMFGGVCHLQHGNMVCGVYKDFLILRLGKEKAEETLQKPHTRPFDITGYPMKGWVMVESGGFDSDNKLTDWLEMARTFVSTLPAK